MGRRKQRTTEETDKTNELRGGGVTQSGISSDLDQFEEPTADQKHQNQEHQDQEHQDRHRAAEQVVQAAAGQV